jgi:hypothetical protein
MPWVFFFMYSYTVSLRTNLDRTGTEQAQNEQGTRNKEQGTRNKEQGTRNRNIKLKFLLLLFQINKNCGIFLYKQFLNKNKDTFLSKYF